MSGRSKASPRVKGETAAKAVLVPSKALAPKTVQVNEERVRRGLIPKLRRVAAKLPFATDVMSLWYCAKDPETPNTAKGMVLAALAYFVLPMDAVPDVLVGIGYTDDAAVIAAVLAIVGRNIKDRHRDAAREALRKFAGDEEATA
jgi:uncharacterized membrane protein YkvA (DUF1232 family)